MDLISSGDWEKSVVVRILPDLTIQYEFQGPPRAPTANPPELTHPNLRGLILPNRGWLTTQGVSLSDFRRFLVEKFIFEGTSPWLSLAQWSFALGLLDEDFQLPFPEQLEVYPDQVYKSVWKGRSFDAFLQAVLLHLLKIYPPGQKPRRSDRIGLVQLLAEQNLSNGGLFREYRSLRKRFLEILSKVVYQSPSPSKAKQAKRKRSSEDSRGKPRVKPWKPSRSLKPRRLELLHFSIQEFLESVQAQLRGSYYEPKGKREIVHRRSIKSTVKKIMSKIDFFS